LSQTKYKDGLFRTYFNNNERLLNLCNALLNTDYKDPSLLKINTLPGIFFGKFKNDLSCVIDDKFLVITEHQSTQNLNMPLRMLFYASELFKEYITPIRTNIYKTKQITLPSPKFFVLYNGAANEPAKKNMYLSKAFGGSKELELKTTFINIRAKRNKKFIQKSAPLQEYVKFVEYVRQYEEQTHNIEQAIHLTIKRCISEGVMKEFLIKHGGELNMTYALEWDEDLARQAREEERVEDIREAKENGVKEGITSMITELLKAGQSVEFISKISKYSQDKVREIGRLNNLL